MKLNKNRLRGKVILITGGSKGIGRETARLCIEAEAVVYICGRDEKALVKASKDLNDQVFTIKADVSDQKQCREMIDSIQKRSGRLDVLINNAGMSMRANIIDLEPRVIEKMFSINTVGALTVTRYALPMLQESKGSVIFISSLSALHGLPGISAYGASKLALKAIAESLRAETREKGVHVGLVYVGFTKNDSDKRVYDAQGNLIALYRPRDSQTQRQTAQEILTCVTRGRKTMVLTPLGKISFLLFRYVPGIASMIANAAAKKSSMYGTGGKDG
jgi:short-subunit dehydrogenase